ncbi:MAG: FecCD family ABC transporter permease [Cyclobacteriaceae bacterium]
MAKTPIQQIISRQKRSYQRRLVILFFLLLVTFLINILLGSVNIPPLALFRSFFDPDQANPLWQNIFLQFRLPKAITAVVVGMGLSVSGLLMQTLFRNPLAGPFVLGISSGATLGVAIVVMASFSFGGLVTTLGTGGNWLVVLASTLGAFSVMLMVVLVSVKVRDSMTLLIIGLMFGSATGALVSVLQYFSDAENIQAFLVWTFGNLGGMTYAEMSIFVPVVFLGLILAFWVQKPLNALLLGERYAESMGVNIKKVRFVIVISTSMMAGAITAFCGPIAFIGVAVPHLARLVFHTSDHRQLLLLVCICGAIALLISDTIAQLPGSEHTLPINAITSLFGAPVIVWLILKQRNFRMHFAG